MFLTSHTISIHQAIFQFIYVICATAASTQLAFVFGNSYPSENNMNIKLPYLPGCSLPSVLMALQPNSLLWNKPQSVWMQFWHMLSMEAAPFFQNNPIHLQHTLLRATCERCTNKASTTVEKKHWWHVPLEPGFVPWNSRSASAFGRAGISAGRVIGGRPSVGWNYTGITQLYQQVQPRWNHRWNVSSVPHMYVMCVFFSRGVYLLTLFVFYIEFLIGFLRSRVFG